MRQLKATDICPVCILSQGALYAAVRRSQATRFVLQQMGLQYCSIMPEGTPETDMPPTEPAPDMRVPHLVRLSNVVSFRLRIRACWRRALRQDTDCGCGHRGPIGRVLATLANEPRAPQSGHSSLLEQQCVAGADDVGPRRGRQWRRVKRRCPTTFLARVSCVMPPRGIHLECCLAFMLGLGSLATGRLEGAISRHI